MAQMRPNWLPNPAGSSPLFRNLKQISDALAAGLASLDAVLVVAGWQIPLQHPEAIRRRTARVVAFPGGEVIVGVPPKKKKHPQCSPEKPPRRRLESSDRERLTPGWPVVGARPVGAIDAVHRRKTPRPVARSAGWGARAIHVSPWSPRPDGLLGGSQ